MRVTLVTETYFPQVNGVSRTLGELVRFLRENGDEVQLIYPDYGAAADREHVEKERDEARKKLLNLGAEYCNTQQNVVTSMDRSQWPDTNLAGADLNVDPYSTLDYDSSPHQFL